jgi:hypothetical protein
VKRNCYISFCSCMVLFSWHPLHILYLMPCTCNFRLLGGPVWILLLYTLYPICHLFGPVRAVYLMELFFIYNFTAEHWCNQSRKWWGCFECGRFHWHENSRGLRKIWTCGESFQVIFVIIHVCKREHVCFYNTMWHPIQRMLTVFFFVWTVYSHMRKN